VARAAPTADAVEMAAPAAAAASSHLAARASAAAAAETAVRAARAAAGWVRVARVGEARATAAAEDEEATAVAMVMLEGVTSSHQAAPGPTAASLVQVAVEGWAAAAASAHVGQ
jgi:hypothetical protein